jgi:hypothetical protein
MWQHRSSPLGEVMPGTIGHVAALEPTSTGRRGLELRNAWRRQSSIQQGDEARGHMPCGSTRAHLKKEVRSGAAGHLAAPESTSVGRCDPKLQLAWQRVDARSTHCFNLELVYRGTRSLGCRQCPSFWSLLRFFMPTWASLRCHNQPMFLSEIRHLSSSTFSGMKSTR